MRQVQALNKNHEDLSGPLIDTYHLVGNTQYLNSKKYRLYRRKNSKKNFEVILRPGWSPPYVVLVNILYVQMYHLLQIKKKKMC